MTKKKSSNTILKKNIMKHTKDYHEELIESLRDPEESSTYLKVALDEYQQDGNAQVLLLALKNVAEAQGGLTNLAKKTQINRQSLYKILSSTGNPTIDTFRLIVKALGFHLLIEADSLRNKNKHPRIRKVA